MKGRNTEEQQPNNINLAEVFSQESRQELTRQQHLEEEREREQAIQAIWDNNDCAKLPEDQSQVSQANNKRWCLNSLSVDTSD